MLPSGTVIEKQVKTTHCRLCGILIGEGHEDATPKRLGKVKVCSYHYGLAQRNGRILIGHNSVTRISKYISAAGEIFYEADGPLSVKQEVVTIGQG
ncbi:MAG: hypothetical protein JW967_01525 [Dehalococcoidales bacterium]|nr:hypothetical protein [Dehalococcoidales bacterium]